MSKLDEGVAIVTGGGSGMGRAAALFFARSGTKVVVADINASAAEETVAQIEGAGGEALACTVDVSSEEDARRMAETAISRFGHLDFASNTAGVSQRPTRLQNLSLDDFARDYAVNAQGVFLSMKYQIPAMLETGGGSIVNVTSGAGMGGFAFYSGYAAAKHAAVGLTKSAALEYADQGIRVNSVAPGTIASPMLLDNPPEIVEANRARLPAKRFGEVEEIASSIVWLCSDAASYVSGQILGVNFASSNTSALGIVSAFPYEGV